MYIELTSTEALVLLDVLRHWQQEYAVDSKPIVAGIIETIERAMPA